MQAKMSIATSDATKAGTGMDLPASGSTMEQFHNWQAEIEAKMEDLWSVRFSFRWQHNI